MPEVCKMEEKRKKRKVSPIGTLVLILIVIALVIIGIFAIKYNFSKVDKAKMFSERILNLYLNSGK